MMPYKINRNPFNGVAGGCVSAGSAPDCLSITRVNESIAAVTASSRCPA